MIWCFYEITKTGIRTIRIPKTVASDDEIIEFISSMSETCVLDIAEDGDLTLDGVGQILGLSKQRVQQIEHYKQRLDYTGGRRKAGALEKIRQSFKRREMLEDFHNDFEAFQVADIIKPYDPVMLSDWKVGLCYNNSIG